MSPISALSPRSIRLPGESDDRLRRRARRVVRVATILVDAALANACVQQFIADPDLPYTEQNVRRCPGVRVDYEEAIAIGDISSCLAATRSKHWGAGPQILPLEPHDPVDPVFILYVYKVESRYNRRYEQRRRLKQLLGKRYRPLVQAAKQHTKTTFLQQLTREQKLAILRILNVSAGEFWRAVNGKIWLPLPPELVQLEFDFGD